MLKEFCVLLGKDSFGNNCFLNRNGTKLSGFNFHIVVKKKGGLLGPKETFSKDELNQLPTRYQEFILPVDELYPTKD